MKPPKTITLITLSEERGVKWMTVRTACNRYGLETHLVPGPNGHKLAALSIGDAARFAVKWAREHGQA